MQVAQTPELQVWHLSGQGMQEELTRVRPGAHDVHWVMLVVLQLEQEATQPRHEPLATTNPLMQVRQVVPLQEMQCLGQVALHWPATSPTPGRQLVQVVAVPLHLRQLLSQGRQVLFDR